MTLRRAAVAVIMTAPSLVLAQTKTPTHFDVISVKPHKPGNDAILWRWDSSGFQASNMRLLYLVTSTYTVQPFLVFGLPPWAQSTHWDIEAKVVDPDLKPMDKLTNDEQKALVLSLLQDRFGMVAHPEDKVQPVFLMTVLPGGTKLQKSDPWPADKPIPKFGAGSVWHVGDGSLTGERITVKEITEVLSNQVERKILDRTNLGNDYYAISLKWTPDRRAGADNGADAAPPLVEALKEQLGFKLTADKAPVPTVVVDKIVQPEAD